MITICIINKYISTNYLRYELSLKFDSQTFGKIIFEYILNGLRLRIDINKYNIMYVSFESNIYTNMYRLNLLHNNKMHKICANLNFES